MKNQKRIAAFLVFIITLCASGNTDAAGLKDAESATHTTDASQYQIVNTYEYPDFKVLQFELPVLSIYSYLLISGNEALLIDPGRDVSVFLETAKKDGVDIKGVYLSHSHADFVAGHMEVVNALKVPIYQSAKSGVKYKTTALTEETKLKIGNAHLKFMDTPGHTPDGMCALVYSGQRTDRPALTFTGDVLFVGSVGRPDLMSNTASAAWLASSMFDSWTQKLSKLPDDTVVLPAHGAGSLCGAHLSDEPSSTIGKERTSNPYLQNTSRSEFVTALLEGLPEAPQYFRHNASMNHDGPALIDWNAPLPPEQKADQRLTDPQKYYLVDLRPAEEYAAGHIPNAINIAARGRLETWVGIMIPWGAQLVLIGSDSDLEEALFRLHRVGYSGQVLSMASWEKAGLPTNRTPPVPPAVLYEQMQRGEAPVIVDVRLLTEWMGLRIGKVLNLPLSHLAELSSQLEKDKPLVAVCNSAYRSSMAIGVLERQGFTLAKSLAGGSEAWINAGLPVYEGVKAGAGATTIAKRQVPLPERISAEDLNRMMMDLPGTFTLVDIRPPEHFQDYSLPGAINVDIGDLVANAAYLTGAGSLVIVDRDGSLGMAAGGIMAQKTARPIKVLFGGLERFWQQNPQGFAQSAQQPAAGKPTVKPSSSLPLPPPAVTPSAPQKPQRKSAGC